MAALGDSFEFVGDAVGHLEHHPGNRTQGRLWFAKVRPKKAGEFAIAYTVRFDYPDELRIDKKGPLDVGQGEYLLPFRVGERGAPRIVFGGSPTASANVGDTFLVPVHVDHYRTGHVFTAPGQEKPEVRASFPTTEEEQHEKNLKRAAAKPLVRIDPEARVELQASWGQSLVNRPLTEVHHSLVAYLEFRKPGEFNLDGRLDKAGEPAVGDGAPFRVVARDQPVTVLVGWQWRREGAGTIDHFQPGTIEARVGDRALIGAGAYVTGATGDGKPEPYPPGVVVSRPFKNVEPYTELPRK